jgi:outer membrane protein TolC
METSVIPNPTKVLPISLGGALSLAGVENPVINLAEQAVRASLIQQFQARILFLPNVNVGANYDLHNGPLEASFGGIRKVDRQAVLYGLGAYSVAAETVKIPGLFINTPLAAVIFDPLVARQVVANRRFSATATRNDILLDVATAYLALLGAEGRLAVIRQSEEDFKEIVRLTRIFARTGQGREGDANRAEADSLALELEEKRAQEDVAVASADLAQLLNLDPSTRLQTGDVPIQVVQFVDPKTPLPQLLEVAARNRPEVLAVAANIRASQVRVRQEKTRPLLPALIMGFSADDFGGGAVASTNGNVFDPHTGFVSGAPRPETGGQTVPKFGRITGRTDADVLAVWTLQNMGFGNIAHVRQRRAELGQAEAEQVRIINEVAREVSEAYNLSAERFRSIEIERRRVQEASNGFQRDLNRIRGGIGFPIEVLNQAKRLASARQDLLKAVVGFDRAQFQLFVALGQPPTLVVEDGPDVKP